ncbi:hypothetical protein LDENG_00087210 [Lucifuga dentata]|nr:hypothetical protein LDENG_00087210 [Lucifuga dentata]
MDARCSRVLNRCRQDADNTKDPIEGKRWRTGATPSSEAEEGVKVRKKKRKKSTERSAPATRSRSLDPRPSLSPARTQGTPASEDARRGFEAKYVQQHLLGKGGYGAVHAGYRIQDCLPFRSSRWLPREVAVMQKLGSAGSAVSLLEWFNLDQELILVMERPVPCVDLHEYKNGGSLHEDQAKVLLKQLLDATLELQSKRIFHRDIKPQNLLIQSSSDVPRLWLIDFGLGCFINKASSFKIFYGTSSHIPPEWHVRGMHRPGPTTVWQVGLVLYEMLHTTKFDTVSFVNKDIQISDELSHDCQTFLRSCLAVNPEQRATLEQLRVHPWITPEVNQPPWT